MTREPVYAGIGSRKTPTTALLLIETLAVGLADDGWTCRSGHARGADQAFERGARGAAEIFLPWPSFEKDVPVAGASFTAPTPEAFELAARFHPAWDSLSRGARALHARNCHQILGLDLSSPVDLVICWAYRRHDGEVIGGTGQALRVARAHNVPIINLFALGRERTV